MLRTLLVLLILVNALFFGWTRGWLDDVVGLRARGDREPERMARQLNPERVKLLGERDVAALQKRQCMEFAGPLDSEAALQAVQASLAKIGVSNATTSSNEQPGLWAVVTIKLGTRDFRERKEETYKRLHVAYEPLTAGSGVTADDLPALLLGRYPSAAAAHAAQKGFEARALQGLRVLQLQAATQHYGLRIAEADGALQARLKTATAKDPALAPGFRACSGSAAAPAASAASGG